MADKKFTLFEVHLGDGHIQIGPESISTGGSGESEPEDERDESVEESSGGTRLLPVVLGLLVLVGVAVVAKKFVDGGEELDELETLDEVETEL